ncbi:hypothetical protein RRG08_000968 [Elysia crispata]|uniref:Uncharacterized protein n=1 Tax=Elysia crispata TaxID=231223 RepID=A0AAE1DYZ9_9GAST|nr:hypothetical protein RRG08_000968 [Elysia crispata]
MKAICLACLSFIVISAINCTSIARPRCLEGNARIHHNFACIETDYQPRLRLQNRIYCCQEYYLAPVLSRIIYDSGSSSSGSTVRCECYTVQELCETRPWRCENRFPIV